MGYPTPLPTPPTAGSAGILTQAGRAFKTFNERPLHISDSDFGVDITGATDSSVGFQAAVDRATSGIAIAIPPSAKIRVDSTIDLGSGTGSSVPRRNGKIYSTGGHGRNEGAPGFGPLVFMPTTDGTMFKMDGTANNQINQWGPIFEGLTFRDTSNSEAGGSVTLFTLRLVNRFTFKECAFLFAKRGVNLDSNDDVVAGGDSAWGLLDNCIWYQNGHGIYSRRTYGHEVRGGQFYRCGRVDGNDLTGAAVELDARSQGWRFSCPKIDGHSSGVSTYNGIRDLGSSNEYLGVHVEKCVTGIKLDGDTGVTGPPSGNWRAVIGCTIVGDGTGTGLHLTANSDHTNRWGNNIHNHTTNVLDESGNGATGGDQDNNVKIGETHSTPGTPGNGVILYVDSSGNLLAKTKSGQVRTVAAV